MSGELKGDGTVSEQSCKTDLWANSNLTLLGDFALEHRFNLLGSGWIQVFPGMECPGFQNTRFSSVPQKTDLAGVSEDYIPIDWHIDIKSGFRWSEKTPAENISWGHIRGVDIKVPWELGRLQHLPTLARCYARFNDDRYLREFRDQLLDFQQSNPVGYGVQWSSAMDVSIRVCNILLARDLFLNSGAELDAEFVPAVDKMLGQHAQILTHALASNQEPANNHRLTVIVGLLFVAVYLPEQNCDPDWYPVALEQFLKTFENQFHEEGSHFEGSTSYHLFCLELAIWGTALVMSKGTNLPSEHFERLHSAGLFTQAITKPDGLLPQIGDNDGGRLFKLSCRLDLFDLAEARERFPNLSLHSNLPKTHIQERGPAAEPVLGCLAGLFSTPNWPETYESSLIRRLAGMSKSGSIRTPAPRLLSESQEHPQDMKRHLFGEWSAPKGSLLENLELQCFPDFGIIVYKSDKLYLAIRCGGLEGPSAHLHDDQLSVELSIEGQNLLRDPGSFVYSPSLESRRQYRARATHNGPCPMNYPDDTGALFRPNPIPRAECLACHDNSFLGRVRIGQKLFFRAISISPQILRIEDFHELDTTLKSYAPPPLSPIYGVLEINRA